MSRTKCIIIDDEELARGLLKTYVEKVGTFELIGSFESALDALQIIKTEAIDLIFLDIQMPDLKGTDFAKLVDAKTKIIFTTAYSEYALDGFELNALDYLLKPITFERFLTAVNKLEANNSNESQTTITVKSGYDLHKLNLEEITHIESDSEYVIFYTGNNKVMSNQSLKSLERSLPNNFMRVHRSFIINKNKVTGLKSRDLILSELRIPVSDSYFELVKKELF